MDVTVAITKPPCGHIHITYTAGQKTKTKTYMLNELREANSYDSVDDAIGFVESQIKKIILDNPEANLATLKNLVESETYKI